jgi:hypothetical protein
MLGIRRFLRALVGKQCRGFGEDEKMRRCIDRYSEMIRIMAMRMGFNGFEPNVK